MISLDELLNLAHKYYKEDKLIKARDLLMLVVSRRQDISEVHNLLGIISKDLNDPENAIKHYNAAIKADLNNANAYSNLSMLYLSRLQYKSAEESVKKSISLKPIHSSAFINLGIILLAQNRIDEAKNAYYKAIKLAPRNVCYWCHLAKCFSFTSTNQKMVKVLLSFEGNNTLNNKENAFLYFTLGKIFKDCQLYEKSYDYYQKANKIRQFSANYNPVGPETVFKDTLNYFTREWFESIPISMATGVTSPVFLIGLPRSGKSLLESILSKHSQVKAAGELHIIPDIVINLNNVDDSYPRCLDGLDADTLDKFRNEYKAYVEDISSNSTTLCIDTMGSNYLHLGLIYLLFPDAKIISCERNLYDCALFNFFKNFDSGNDYSYNVKNLAHYTKYYQRTVDFWSKTYPSQIYKIDYEELINNTDYVVKNVIKYLGLDFESSLLAGDKLHADEINALQDYPEFVAEFKHYI